MVRSRPRLKTLRPRISEVPARIASAPALSGSGATPRLSDRSGHAWAVIRERVLAEEPLCRPCQNATPRRTSASLEVDHIRALEDGGSDERSNLQGICRDCHVAKTAREGKARREHR